MFEIPFVRPWLPEEEACKAVCEVIRSGWLTTGPRVERVEWMLREMLQAPSVVCVNSATAGLFLTLKWWGIQEGDEVLVPAYTYCATANVVIHTGARPVFVDVREEDATVCPEDLARKFSDRTRAIITVDVLGMPVQYDAVREVLETEGKRRFRPRNSRQATWQKPLWISDCAHSLGARYRGVPVGTQADVSVFSFHAVKNLTCGEGGCVVISPGLEEAGLQASLVQFIRQMALHGQTRSAHSKFREGKWMYDVEEPGWKMNMPDLLAVLLEVTIPHYDVQILEPRRKIFHQYDVLLRTIRSALSPDVEIRLPRWRDDLRESSAHVYGIRIRVSDSVYENQSFRNRVLEEMAKMGVQGNVHFPVVPALQAYRRRGYQPEDVPVAWKYSCEELSLPVYPGLREEEVQRVVEVLVESIRKSGR